MGLTKPIEHLADDGPHFVVARRAFRARTELGAQRVETLVDILDRGGASFRLANPESWPLQAQLAADNQWKELKRLQREMIGGLPPAEPQA